MNKLGNLIKIEEEFKKGILLQKEIEINNINKKYETKLESADSLLENTKKALYEYNLQDRKLVCDMITKVLGFINGKEYKHKFVESFDLCSSIDKYGIFSREYGPYRELIYVEEKNINLNEAPDVETFFTDTDLYLITEGIEDYSLKPFDLLKIINSEQYNSAKFAPIKDALNALLDYAVDSEINILNQDQMSEFTEKYILSLSKNERVRKQNK